MKNKIFFFLPVAILLALNSCNNSTEPVETTGSVFEMPVVPGLIITYEGDPTPYGIWRNPHTPGSIYYGPGGNDSNAVTPYYMALDTPYPNPTSASNSIRFAVSNRTEVSLTLVKARLPEDEADSPETSSGGVFVSSGRNPAVTLLDKKLTEAGYYEVDWSGKNDKGEDVPAGFYRVYLEADGHVLWCDILLARTINDLPAGLRGKVLFEN
jgi:hypothetical protein